MRSTSPQKKILGDEIAGTSSDLREAGALEVPVEVSEMHTTNSMTQEKKRGEGLLPMGSRKFPLRQRRNTSPTFGGALVNLFQSAGSTPGQANYREGGRGRGQSKHDLESQAPREKGQGWSRNREAAW